MENVRRAGKLEAGTFSSEFQDEPTCGFQKTQFGKCGTISQYKLVLLHQWKTPKSQWLEITMAYVLLMPHIYCELPRW